MRTIVHPDGVVENVHPSMLPENQARCQLHQVFHNFFVEEIGRVIGKEGSISGMGGDHSIPEGYERAWGIFLGTYSNGEFHFVCHIAENHSTAKAYNCADTTSPDHPVLLFGAPIVIESKIMDSVWNQFPNHHRGNVPCCQMALAITPRRREGRDSGTLEKLVDGTITTLTTRNFRVQMMAPTGTSSLSFKREHFPLEFWTHTSRAPVIHTALRNELAKPQQNPTLIGVYQKACDLENDLAKIAKDIEDLKKAIGANQKKLQRQEESKKATYEDMRIPANRKANLLVKKAQEITTTKQEIRDDSNKLAQLEADLAQASRAIQDFKKTNWDVLPNSYREATFQVAFDQVQPDGSVVYKQYNGRTGYFELSQASTRDVRFGNDVHNPYSSF